MCLGHIRCLPLQAIKTSESESEVSVLLPAKNTLVSNISRCIAILQ